MPSDDRMRALLTALLPRLRRMAVLLAGTSETGDRMLARTCRAMLDSPPAQDGDIVRAALATLHALWLEDRRRNGGRDVVPSGEELAASARVAAGDDDKSELEEVAAALAALSPQQRAALLLVYGEGLSHREAAEVLDVTPETVAARASRALGVMAERLPAPGAAPRQESVQP